MIVKEQLALQQLGMMLGSHHSGNGPEHVEVEWIRADIDGRI